MTLAKQTWPSSRHYFDGTQQQQHFERAARQASLGGALANAQIIPFAPYRENFLMSGPASAGLLFCRFSWLQEPPRKAPPRATLGGARSEASKSSVGRRIAFNERSRSCHKPNNCRFASRLWRWR